MAVHANQEPLEGSITGASTLTFTRKSRTLEIINDSPRYDLEYKFNDSENYATLKPLEAVSMAVHIRELYLNSPSSKSVAYRIRVIG
jgi:hypothetical protein